MALRTMSPEIIACDELSQEYQENISRSLYSGIPVIATVHANASDLLQKEHIRRLLETKAFETVVFLHNRKNPGEVKRIVKAGELLEGNRSSADSYQRLDTGIYAGAKTEKSKIGVA